jgi:hypothetical protein
MGFCQAALPSPESCLHSLTTGQFSFFLVRSFIVFLHTKEYWASHTFGSQDSTTEVERRTSALLAHLGKFYDTARFQGIVSIPTV